MTKEEFIKRLSRVPQKYEYFTTISYQMKYDIYEFFKDMNLNCIEIGCNRGYTTSTLTPIFNKVVGVDISEEFVEHAKLFNVDAKQLEFEILNETNKWEDVQKKYPGVFDVALIDSEHTYDGCKRDIQNAIQLGCKYLIFDDVSIYDDIKKCLDEFIKDPQGNEIEFVKPIGINWNTYRLPELSMTIIPIRIDNINFSFHSGKYESFIWMLKDERDIELNEGVEWRKCFDPMNTKISVVKNYADIVNGHVETQVFIKTPNVCQTIYMNEDRFFILNGLRKPSIEEHTFIPFPAHRFPMTVLNSMMDIHRLSDDDGKMYEGCIIKLK